MTRCCMVTKTPAWIVLVGRVEEFKTKKINNYEALKVSRKQPDFAWSLNKGLRLTEVRAGGGGVSENGGKGPKKRSKKGPNKTKIIFPSLPYLFFN